MHEASVPTNRPEGVHPEWLLMIRIVAALGMAFTAVLAGQFVYPGMPPASLAIALLLVSLPMLVWWRLWMRRRWPVFLLLGLNGLVFLAMLPQRSYWGYATGSYEILGFLLLSSLLLVGLLLLARRALKPGF